MNLGRPGQRRIVGLRSRDVIPIWVSYWETVPFSHLTSLYSRKDQGGGSKTRCSIVFRLLSLQSSAICFDKGSYAAPPRYEQSQSFWRANSLRRQFAKRQIAASKVRSHELVSCFPRSVVPGLAQAHSICPNRFKECPVLLVHHRRRMIRTIPC